MMLPVNRHIEAYPRSLQAECGLNLTTNYDGMSQTELIARILSLEEQICNLQGTVCYLLLKGESLRSGSMWPAGS